jgi:glycosyltransferase involved in cell wall biosynthesis
LRSAGDFAPAAAPARRGLASGLRVALFSGNYNCVRDGANKALNRLVAYLLSEGAAVRVYSPTVEEPAFEPAGDLVSVPSFGIPFGGRSEYRLARGLPKSIRADILRFAPTHFHVSAPDFMGQAAIPFARKLGVPVIASMHTRFETYFEYYGLEIMLIWARWHLKRFYTRADYVLVPNPPMVSNVEAMGVARDRIRIWGRGVERDRFDPARRSLAWRRAHGFRDDEPVLLFFGRLVREKGIDMFEAVVRLLRERGLAVRPLFVGEGPARAEIEPRIGEAVFAGHLEGPALGTAVASSDILVNPSVTEAFGNVNLEAMAAGLAIVSADVGSASSLIEQGRTGLLVRSDDPIAYADAVAGLIAEPGRRRALGEAAAKASAAYEWPDVLRAVVDVYHEAAQARAAA